MLLLMPPSGRWSIFGYLNQQVGSCMLCTSSCSDRVEALGWSRPGSFVHICVCTSLGQKPSVGRTMVVAAQNSHEARHQQIYAGSTICTTS